MLRLRQDRKPPASGGGPPYDTTHFPRKYHSRFLLDSYPGRYLARVGGPSVCQVNLRASLTSPGTGGAENDLRLTLLTRGPPTFPKVEPQVFIDGPPGILHECTRDPGRRSRAMSRNALKIYKNERVGSLRFSLWKPSPFLVLLLWHQPTASELLRLRQYRKPPASGGGSHISNIFPFCDRNVIHVWDQLWAGQGGPIVSQVTLRSF